jgi:plastocyanin
MRFARVRIPAAWSVVAAVAVGSVMLIAAPAPARTKVISGTCAIGCKWSPNVRQIRAGSKIVWKVPFGDTRHNVTAYRARGSRRWLKNTDIAPSGKTGHVFRRPGTYRFLCDLHPTTMRGRIRVVG